MRSNARLKYLVHTLGIDDFRTLTEKYYGKKILPWAPLPPWQYLDWMGWHEQGDGKWMFGINVEQGRVRDTPELRLKSALRELVDSYPVDLILTPSQSIVIKNIEAQVQDASRTPLAACTTLPPPPAHHFSRPPLCRTASRSRR